MMPNKYPDKGVIICDYLFYEGNIKNNKADGEGTLYYFKKGQQFIYEG